jgi:hypothetical protein
MSHTHPDNCECLTCVQKKLDKAMGSFDIPRGKPRTDDRQMLYLAYGALLMERPSSAATAEIHKYLFPPAQDKGQE